MKIVFLVYIFYNEKSNDYDSYYGPTVYQHRINFCPPDARSLTHSHEFLESVYWGQLFLVINKEPKQKSFADHSPV